MTDTDLAAIDACRESRWPTVAELFPECVANRHAITTELPKKTPKRCDGGMPLFEQSGHGPAGTGRKTKSRSRQERQTDHGSV